MGEHSGKTALVTGGARGIGLALARKLAACGASLMLTDVEPIEEDIVAGIAEAHGVNVSTAVMDVTVKAEVDELVDYVVGEHGGIDLLFNNAGIIEIQPFLEADESAWDRIMAVNGKGVFLCGQAVARTMVERGSGCIVNVASMAARVGIPDMAIYAASKAAVMSLTRSMALALAPAGIRVNAVAPGIVDTDMWTKVDSQRAAIEGVARGEPFRQRVSSIPLGRPATADDVVDVAQFLFSDAARYVTGQTVQVDGGALPS